MVDADRYDQTFSPSTLVHNFLTPEYSSENQYSDPSVPTTPSWEENWWPPDNSIGPLESATSINEGSARQNSLSMNNDAARTYNCQRSSEESGANLSHPPPQLMSPQLTNTPSPSAANSQTFAMGPRSAPFGPTAQRDRQGTKSQSSGLRVNPSHTPANSGSSSNSLQASPSEPLNMATSPILMVSTYNRGDSPARSRIRLARSSSKRSRTSQSSNFLAPANHYSSGEDEDELEKDHIQHPSPHVARTEEGSWLPNTVTGQAGLDPTARGGIHVPSLKEIEERKQLEEKNAEVESWLDKSEAGSDLGEDVGSFAKPRRRPSKRPKPRSHSTGARPDTLQSGVIDDSGIPGPGALLDEDSEAAYTDDSASPTSAEDILASPVADIDVHSRDMGQGYFDPIEETPPEQEEPLPNQFIRAQPWQDPVGGPILQGASYQPATANAAMYKYDLLAAKFETASRAATWGTRRRLSETDIQSIISGQSVRKLSLAQKTRERGNSIVKQAAKLIPRRSSSNLKKRDTDIAEENPSTESARNKRTDTLSSLRSLQRIPSIGKAPKSPPLNTGSAFVAMTGQITAVGRSTSATPDTATLPPSPWKPFKRQRSKSEIPRRKSSSTPGLAELMTNHGGPPVPTLVSPMQERRSAEQRPRGPVANDEGEDEDVEEEAITGQGTKLDLKVKIDNIVPNADGFRTHVRQLNPRLEPFLTERIVLEQVRRYKKLVENKVKHTHAVKNRKQCPSDSFCFELGGEAKDLPPRTSTKDPDATCAQFQVSGNGDSEGEANTFAEGIVTAALFPVGIPLPPVKRLPAEFECLLCFKVKKFQKPSDWTKHVHEDVQPFTCTFAHCSEARSFKRKADWVRHENERHRHLEWWQCNMPECNHICYRKDNFVQHLVREHKKREPKVKSRGSTSSKSKPELDSVAARQARMQEEENEEVWKLVDRCHFETQQKPKDEPCKFCGNICSSWKKLTVHLAKHMEQIAMPVLDLVKRREVSPDTIISPVERSSRQQPAKSHGTQEGITKTEPNSLSPYVRNMNRPHSGLQATQSPSAYSQDSHYTHSMQNSPSFSHTTASAYDAQVTMPPPDMAQFVQMYNLPANMSYGPYQNVRQPSSFVPINTPGAAASTYPSFTAMRRSSPHQIVPNGSHTHPGLFQTSANYDGQPPQQPVYSSPTDTASYPAHYDMSMDEVQHNYTASTMAYDHSALPAGMEIPPNLIYDAQQGPTFLANQSTGHNYPYTTQ